MVTFPPFWIILPFYTFCTPPLTTFLTVSNPIFNILFFPSTFATRSDWRRCHWGPYWGVVGGKALGLAAAENSHLPSLLPTCTQITNVSYHPSKGMLSRFSFNPTLYPTSIRWETHHKLHFGEKRWIPGPESTCPVKHNILQSPPQWWESVRTKPESFTTTMSFKSTSHQPSSKFPPPQTPHKPFKISSPSPSPTLETQTNLWWTNQGIDRQGRRSRIRNCMSKQHQNISQKGNHIHITNYPSHNNINTIPPTATTLHQSPPYQSRNDPI